MIGWTILLLCASLYLRVEGSCSVEECVEPDCRCMSTTPPMQNGTVPQLVMLTFDDSVTVSNFPTYKKIFMSGRKNAGNGCPIAGTFFVTHEYTNYHFVHQLYRHGHEIAVHSISHQTNTDIWKLGNYSLWSQELGGMRTLVSKFAKIPISEVRGVRAPFLQTAGDVTFSVLRDLNFTYDSSMPTLSHTSPPIWPYTLDQGYQQDCQIQPCPTGRYRGLWLLSMINYRRRHHPCSMADACLPLPETADETLTYLRENFERHYNSSRAPFPLYLHHAWLQHEGRLNGYVQFLDWLQAKDDVYMVSSADVVDYMRNPIDKVEYDRKGCGTKLPRPDLCRFPGTTCEYLNIPPYGGTRYMVVCGKCPVQYPWTSNPEGV